MLKFPALMVNQVDSEVCNAAAWLESPHLLHITLNPTDLNPAIILSTVLRSNCHCNWVDVTSHHSSRSQFDCCDRKNARPGPHVQACRAWNEITFQGFQTQLRGLVGTRAECHTRFHENRN